MAACTLVAQDTDLASSPYVAVGLGVRRAGAADLANLVKVCDSAVTPLAVCSEIWSWAGMARQVTDDPAAEAYYKKALAAIDSQPGDGELALCSELEAQAQHILGEETRASKLLGAAAKLREHNVATLQSGQVRADPVFRVGNGVTPPKLISRVQPEYTEAARLLGRQGMVQLSIVVDKDGMARDVRLVKNLGFGLDERAVDCVMRWHFSPGTKDGDPVAVRATIQVNFKLL